MQWAIAESSVDRLFVAGLIGFVAQRAYCACFVLAQVIYAAKENKPRVSGLF